MKAIKTLKTCTIWQEMADKGMSRRPKFEPIETKDGWMVSIPEKMAPDGKRVRRFFTLKKEAGIFAGSLRERYHAGERGGSISHELAVMAASANELLLPHGVTILDAARSYVARIEAGGSTETFGDRYGRALIDNESRWRSRYMLDMERLPRWVGKEFMKTRLADITPDMIIRALRSHGAAAQSTLDNRGRYVSAIINFKPRHHKQSKVEIMSLAQCRQFLRACESPAERWAAALLLFAGIRPSAEDGEITRLDWSHVGSVEIYVPHDVSKTGTDRHIPLTPRLTRLLRGHPAEGPVTPANWRRVYQRLRRGVAGIEGKQDVMRHTFASHFLAAFDEKATKAAMGHTAGSQTLFRHYRRAVNEAAGIKFFR